MYFPSMFIYCISSTVASLGGFQGFLETSQAPAIAYYSIIIQLLVASYSLEATAIAFSQQVAGASFSMVYARTGAWHRAQSSVVA